MAAAGPRADIREWREIFAKRLVRRWCEASELSLQESRERDPFRFPFEEYYFADVKGKLIERALTLPPGQYDLFIALVDRAKVPTSSPTVIRRTIDVPNF